MLLIRPIRPIQKGMKMRILMTLMLVAGSLSLGACNVSARDGNTSVTVNNPDGYNHCPPGHAKKGWC